MYMLPKNLPESALPVELEYKGIKANPEEPGFKRAVLKAHAQLGGQLINPVNYYNLYKSYEEGRGLLAPGARYVGPGNPTPLKIHSPQDLPTSVSDAAARLHDLEYERLLALGVDPKSLYLGFRTEDQELIDRSDPTEVHGLVTKYGMLAKKHITSHLVPESEEDPGKNLTED